MFQHLKIHTKYIVLSLILLILVVAAAVFFILQSSKERHNDYKRILAEEYDTVFLSMFPIDNYEEDDYAYYRAQYILKTDYCIPNIRTLDSYLKKIATSGNMVSTIYLGICPEKISPDRLLELLREYPSVNYHIILSYPSASYWSALSDPKWKDILDSYRLLTDTLLTESNLSLYLFSQEWLICNPTNYEDVFLTTPDISRTLMLNCDRDHSYLITPENIDSVFTTFSQLVERICTAPDNYPDLSDYKIVFFGDSVIGNYTDSASIPGVINGLTKAIVYNCGYGGGTASYSPDTPITLPDIAEAFLNKDTTLLSEALLRKDPSLTLEDSQVYKGITEYIQDTSDTEHLCFVINYGLNDYFVGAPVSTADPLDITSYSGALGTTINLLQQAYPKAQIILMTPNFTSYFNNGESKKSDIGGTLEDYVNAVISIGEEYDVEVLNNYADLNINADNQILYLEDGCHPNAATRFTIGNRIALNIK